MQEEDGPLGVVVADASGKGLPAALLACQVQAWLKSELASDTDLPSILARLNRQLVRFTPGNRFVTLVCARLCCETGELAMTSAGHERAIRVTAGGEAELLPAGGPPLGMLDTPHYPTRRVRLERGDLLVLYSDGVTETTDSRGVEYGNGRLVHQLIDTRAKHPRLVLERLIEALERFSGGAPLDDDRTVLILKRS